MVVAQEDQAAQVVAVVEEITQVLLQVELLDQMEGFVQLLVFVMVLRLVLVVKEELVEMLEMEGLGNPELQVILHTWL